MPTRPRRRQEILPGNGFFIRLVATEPSEAYNNLNRMSPSDSATQPKILITSPIDPIAHELLQDLFPLVTAPKDDRETLLDLLPGTKVLISRGLAPIDGSVMGAAPGLAAICRTGAGYENIDIEAATDRSIPVIYAPLLGPAVAEATFAMILALVKRLFYWHQSLIEGHWDRRVRERTDELEGKTIGIVGLGRIGREMARRALAFDMRVLAYDPYVAAPVAEQVSARLVPLDKLMVAADVITVHAVSTPETDNLIDSRNLELVRPGSYFLNFARGALIENLDILYQALMDGRLAGVGLDVFPQEPPRDLEHPLFRHPNFIGSPMSWLPRTERRNGAIVPCAGTFGRSWKAGVRSGASIRACSIQPHKEVSK